MPKFESFKILHDGIEREYLFLQNKIKSTLIVVLHGFRVRPKVMFQRYAKVYEKGFPLLFPLGVNDSWNVGNCCGAAFELKLNDADFIEYVTKKVLAEQFQGEVKQAYITGTSNGAFMTSILALKSIASRNVQWIRGIILIAGYSYDLNLYSQAINANYPKFPILALHGFKDDVVPISGKFNCSFFGNCVSFRDSFFNWQEINQCQNAKEKPMIPLPIHSSIPSNCFTGRNCKESVIFCELPKSRHKMDGCGDIVAEYLINDLNRSIFQEHDETYPTRLILLLISFLVTLFAIVQLFKILVKNGRQLFIEKKM